MTNRSGFTGQRVKPLLEIPDSLLRGFEEALLAKVNVIITSLKLFNKESHSKLIIGNIQDGVIRFHPHSPIYQTHHWSREKAQVSRCLGASKNHLASEKTQVPKRSYLLLPSWPQRIKMVKRGSFSKFVNFHYFPMFAVVHLSKFISISDASWPHTSHMGSKASG